MSDAGANRVLAVSNLNKFYGSLHVLKGLSFDLRHKEILGVIGPSGSGKSTLLRCLNLLEWPDAGTIHYLGRLRLEIDGDTEPAPIADNDEGDCLDSRDLCLFRSRIGLVFQGFNLWEDRTVTDNLTLAPRIVLREPRATAERRAIALCEQFGLEAKLGAHIQSLSGGQRQRVAIIRALMMQPEIVLLDEVTSALDPVLTVEVMQAIRQLRDRGLTMIVVTHHLEFASTLCDRLMFLSDGIAVQIDSPENLRNNPATGEVAHFVQVLERAR